MNPRLYLAHAEKLVQQVRTSGGLASASGEAECRSAISRAYYAAFLVAVEFLATIGIQTTKTGKGHVVTQQGLNNSSEPDLVAAAAHLSTLYSGRQDADYDMQDVAPEDVDQAEAMVELASETIGLLDNCQRECSADPGKGQTVAATILGWATTAGQQHSLWKKRK